MENKSMSVNDLRRRVVRFIAVLFCVGILGSLIGVLVTSTFGEGSDGTVSRKTVLELEDEFAKLVKYLIEKNEATFSTEKDDHVLRQIAEAQRIQTRTSILLLRQNNEVIRLLKKIAKEQ